MFFAQSTIAQDPCAVEKAKIDERLEMPGYTAQQKKQGEQLKSALDMMCGMGGQQVAAPLMAQLDQVLPLPTAADIAMSTFTKDDLSSEYLQGPWCREGQEATNYDFGPDGTYRYAVVGFNVGPDGHHYFPERKSNSEFVEEFDHLRSKGDDQFVMSNENRGKHSKFVFTRGEGTFMTSGAAG